MATILVVAAMGAWIAGEVGLLKQMSRAELKTFEDEAAARVANAELGADHSFSAFRAEDLRRPDRLALTARMLRLDAGAELTHGFFLFDANGRLVAATGLLPAERGNVAGEGWFHDALANREADDAAAISGVTFNPLGDAKGAVIYRRLVDPSGVVGVIGTFLDESSLRHLLAPAGRFGAITVTLGGPVPLIFAPKSMNTPLPALAALAHALQRLGIATEVETRAIMPHSTLIWSGAENYVTAMSPADATRLLRDVTHVAIGAAFAVFAAFLFGQMVERRRKHALSDPASRAAEARARHLAAFDPSSAVWFWFLDKECRISGVGGNVPKIIEDRVYGLNGLTMAQDFPAVAGHAGALPASWEDILRAIRQGQPFTDIEADFILGEGRVMRLSLSGQPQYGEEGGFWGIARPAMVAPVMVAEEERPRARAAEPAPAGAKAIADKLAA
jgi:hypothetical protein